MKKAQVLLLAGLTAVVLLSGCGKKSEEVNSAIDPITVEAETISESAAPAESVTAEEEYDDDCPGEGYVRSALTNEWVKQEVYDQRPIAVMMPTDSAAQPQFNIGNAGVLYEVMEEGSISRQLAVIEDWHEMEKIGNIRSCRLYYIYLACEWDPILVHFGGVYYMQDMITRSDVNNISGAEQYGTPGGGAPGSGAFFRSSDHAAPHNAYTSGKNLMAQCDSLGYDLQHRSQYYQPEHFNFTPAAKPNTLEDAPKAETATKINLSDVFPVTSSYLEYDEKTGTYLKWLHNKPQIDAVTNEQLGFENVIVQYTYSEVLDAKDYKAFQIHDTTRDGYYFTKGKCIHVNWKKTQDYEPTKYYDDAGNEIVMNTGKTYIAIAQEGTKASWQ